MSVKNADKINRTEFIDRLAEKLGLSKTQAEKTLGVVLDLIKELLVEGYKINLTGFGLFGVSKRSARQGINPKTGEKMSIPATKSVSFKPSKPLKESVN